jgi:hypothetical protein
MSTETYKGYKFRYVHDIVSPGKVRVYIEKQPSYQGRSRDPYVIHRYPGMNGAPPYICFKENFKPTSYSEARKLARKWADLTNGYIRTGMTISEQIRRGY